MGGIGEGSGTLGLCQGGFEVAKSSANLEAVRLISAGCPATTAHGFTAVVNGIYGGEQGRAGGNVRRGFVFEQPSGLGTVLGLGSYLKCRDVAPCSVEAAHREDATATTIALLKALRSPPQAVRRRWSRP